MVDSAFAGNISYTDLAAVSLGSNTFNVLLLCMIGICIASSVKAGQALGAGDNKAMLNCFRQGSLLCIVIGLFFSILLLFSDSFMISLGQEADVVELTKSYLYWFSWTLPLQAMIILIRSYFAVIDQPWASVFPILLTLFLNTFLNYCLATGNLGFPAMGIFGIGLASFLSNAFLVILMLRNIGWATVRDIFSFTHPDVNKDKGLFRLLLISLPIAVTLFTEEAFFSGTVFLAGALGAAEQAAHQILFNTINTSYLFNTGIAIACSIIIGKQVGAGEFTKIIPSVKAGWVLAQVFTLPFALVLLFFGDQWISLFLDTSKSSNQATVLLVKSVMLLALFMLFIDAIWLIIIESLHGLLDTTYPAVCALLAYWLIGGPLAYWSIHNMADAFTWIWIAMLISACLLTVMLLYRLMFKVRQLCEADQAQKKGLRNL